MLFSQEKLVAYLISSHLFLSVKIHVHVAINVTHCRGYFMVVMGDSDSSIFNGIVAILKQKQGIV